MTASACLRGMAACLALAAAAAGAAPLALITNQGSHDVSVIDVAAARVVATLPVGRSPAGVVAHAASGRAYVSNPDSRSISVIDLAARQVRASWPAGDGPVGLDVSSDGRWLLVADWYRQRLRVHDTTQPEAPVREWPVGRAPAGVAAGDAGLAYVAERDDDRVAEIELHTGVVRRRFSTGSHPFALLRDAARQRLYALNVQSDDVSVIDLPSGRSLATLKVGRAPYGAALADAGRRLYISNQHGESVSVFDADTLKPLATLGGFAYPEGVAAHGPWVLVVNWMDDDVSLLEAASGKLLARIPVGRNPRGFGSFIADVKP